MSTAESEAIPKKKASPTSILLAILGVLILFGMGWCGQQRATNHSAQLKISGDPAVVKVTYGYTLPNASQNQVLRQTNELSASVEWESSVKISGLEPTVTLHVERQAGDNRPLSCAVIVGDESSHESMAPGQTELLCQVTVRNSSAVRPTPSPSGTAG